MSKATGVEGISRTTLKRKKKTEWKPARYSYFGKTCCHSGGPDRHFEGNWLGKMFMDARKAPREGCFRVK